MYIKTQFDIFLDKIRSHLHEYLEQKGYSTSGAIRCLNPNHNDNTPSMLCANAEKNGWRLWCTQCGFRADIFDAFSILEGTPRSGPAWIQETVLPLAGRFHIEAPVIDVSSEDQFRFDLYRVYDRILGLLEHDPEKISGPPKEYVLEKQWTKEILEALDIGTVNYEKICNNTSAEERERFGLKAPTVFSQDNLIFAVRDSYGRPIRFFARKPLGSKPKFDSTSTSTLAVDIWRGMGHLYLSHLLERTSSTAFLVEGQPDAVSMYQHGIKNVVGMCGCKAFGEAHADTLALNGISRVVLMYDGDEAGQEAARALLDKDFVKKGGLLYDIIVMPAGHDSDSFIRKEGIEKFNYLITENRMSSFEFLLSRMDPSTPAEETCQKLLPYIAASRSDISREKMARELSSFLSEEISIGAILSDVKRIDERVVSEALEKKKLIVTAATRQAQGNIEQASEIFRQAMDKIDQVEKAKAADANAKNTCLSRVVAYKTRGESRTLGDGFELIPGRLQSLADALSGGEWTGSKLFLVGAIQSMGKSSFVNALAWEIISNPKNNAIAYIQSLDDPMEAVVRRLGCCVIGDPDFSQNMMANPRYYAEELGVPEVYEKREMAYAKIFELISAGRLIIEDSRDGRTIAHADSTLRRLRRENPDANIIHCLDNIHDADDWPTIEPVERMNKIVTYEKTMLEFHRVTGICTAEYRKGDPAQPGSDEDLAGHRKLKFAPHLTLHIFSDAHAKGVDKALLIHRHRGELRPRVRVGIGKNKVTSVKSGSQTLSLCYDFHPAASLFFSVPLEQAIKDEKKRREELNQTEYYSDDDGHNENESE